MKIFTKFEWKAFALFAVSAAMLSVIGAPVNCSWLAWVTIVPFVLACRPEAKPLWLAVAAWAVGFLYWVGNLYWLLNVTWVGQIGVSWYLGLYWAALALAVRWCRGREWPMFVVVPVLWVGTEALQGWAFTGFPWRFLSHSQYQNIMLIQCADIFGAAGVSFLIGMVNGFAAEMVEGANKFKTQNSKLKIAIKKRTVLQCVIMAALIGGTLFYGHWRVKEYDKVVRVGPMVAAVQPNVPQEVKEQEDKSPEILADMLYDNQFAVESRALLIAWPETMVEAHINPEVLALADPNSQARVFDAQLRKATQGKAYLLVGAMGATIKWKDHTPDLDQKYNSAFLYRPDGRQDPQRYDKVHLVPFGEVVPFKQTIPPLYRLFMLFTPYDFDYTLDYGTEYTIFDINDAAAKYRFGVLICYEDTVPYVARHFAVDENGRKKADWLVNISNDGWFVSFKNGKVVPSAELPQHAAICVFRAVENRLAVLRSVNTGISCLVDSAGRIRDGFVMGRLPQKAMERKGVRGWFADRIPIDPRVTVFSRYGQWLDIICGGLFVILVVGAMINQKSKIKMQK